MAALRLLIFKRGIFKLPVGFCHWALFIPGEGEGCPDGILFEALGKRKYWIFTTTTCLKVSKHRRSKLKVAHDIEISEISVNPKTLKAACGAVTKDRPFNQIFRNCQHWVFEVIQYLVDSQYIDNGVEILAEIRERGFSPLVGRWSCC